MTHEMARHIENSARRCTEATLMAFGIQGAIPKMANGCLQYLELSGYKTKLTKWCYCQLREVEFENNKQYFINTRGHAMALINGILVDTKHKGFDKRKVDFIWEVSK